jgi:hypothetical protein
MTPYLYVFIRTDIPVRDQLCQVGHSCAHAGKLFKHPDETHIVLLKVKNEKALTKAAYLCAAHDIKFTMFYEPDDQMGHTSLATETIYGNLREVFSEYKTWDLI